MNIVEPILFQCKRQPPAAAICVPGSGIGLISYRRLELFVHNITRRVHALGLPKQSIVAVNIKDDIFHIAVLLALMRLGMVTLSLRENDGSLPIKVDALIADPTFVSIDMGRIILADLGWTEGDGLPLAPEILPETHESDLCRIILTSGTMSTPKAVALSHGMMAARMARHLSVFGNRLANCSRIYSEVPVSSSLGFVFLIYSLWRGGTTFFPGKDFETTLPAIEQYKVQCIVGSPGGFENLLRWFDALPSYQSNIEILLCAGDVLSKPLADRLRTRICSHLVTYYGSTEASMSASAHAHEIVHVPRAVGFVTPGVTIEIIDPSGNVLPHEQEGLVRLKTRYAVDGYFGDSDQSRKVFRDGWFYPGDLGWLTSTGLLGITGRENAVLNLGGDKINPEFIELTLSQFPGVTQVAAFGVPNEYGINEICVAIVGNRPIDHGAVKEYCTARIPIPFSPSKFYFVASLPHNDMGKIERNRLQAWVEQGGRPA